MSITSEIVTVDPKTAKDWLANQNINRTIKEKQVARIARDMLVGNWQLNGESIIFDDSGNLIDGQHRLKAVIVSDTTVPMMIVRGVSPVAQKTIDAGMTRSLGDYLTFSGMRSGTKLASFSRIVWFYRRGVFPACQTSAPPSQSELIGIAEETYEEFLPIYNQVAVHYRQGIKNLFPCPPLVFLVWITGEANQNKSMEFVEKLYCGKDLGSSDAVYHLRNTLIGLVTKRLMLGTRAKWVLLIRAWNYHYENKLCSPQGFRANDTQSFKSISGAMYPMGSNPDVEADS